MYNVIKYKVVKRTKKGEVKVVITEQTGIRKYLVTDKKGSPLSSSFTASNGLLLTSCSMPDVNVPDEIFLRGTDVEEDDTPLIFPFEEAFEAFEEAVAEYNKKKFKNFTNTITRQGYMYEARINNQCYSFCREGFEKATGIKLQDGEKRIVKVSIKLGKKI